MVIISQNKNRIINFDNILEIWIDSNILDKTEPVFIINAETDGTVIEIGNYATEERAKEVLQEIVKSYRDYRTAECDGYTNVLQETAVFEMPKE